MTDFPDRVRNEDLPGLTTDELASLYTQRCEKADFVWGQLMVRVVSLQMYEQQCERQKKLLLECYHALEQHPEHHQLAERLASHFEHYGISPESPQGA